jgi:uncharacterized membrane protein
MPVSNYRKSRNGPLRGLERVNAYNPLKGLQVRVTHPKQIGLLATCLSALAGSFFFVALLNIGTALFVQICTINEVGPATGVCSYVPSPPNAAQIGNHPEYTSATGGLIVAAMIATGARYIAQHIAGVWGQGDVDLWFTILRMLKAMVVKDELPLYGKRFAAMVCQGIGAFAAVLATWGFLQGRSSYSSGGEGLGGPGIGTYGLQSVLRTHFLMVLVCVLRGLIFLWASVESTWSSETDKKDDGKDPLSVGITHHAKSALLAFGDGALVVVFGKIFGTGIGFFWRDIASLALTEHQLVAAEANEGFSLWLISTLFAFIGYLISIVLAFAMLWAIKANLPMDPKNN